MHQRSVCFALFFAGLGICGCAHDRPPAPPRPAPTTEAVTPASIQTARPQYWINRPAVASAASADYDRLWQACLEEMRREQFFPDRTDYRDGVMTSRPMVSKQFFELWRDDAGTVKDVADSSLNTIRRTIRFELTRATSAGGDGGGEQTATANPPRPAFVAVPKVVVEQLFTDSRRLTSATEYQSAFAAPGPHAGSREADEGIELPQRYWYAIGRDAAMEKRLAARVENRVRAGNQ